VEWLVRSGQHALAFQTARVHSAVPAFVAALHAQPGGEATQAGYNLAVQYYEERALWGPAAELHAKLGNAEAAVQLFLKVPPGYNTPCRICIYLMKAGMRFVNVKRWWGCMRSWGWADMGG
jgi:hypothetical protein